LPSPAPLPTRVWVVGPCGAGKTRVATRLAAALGVDATHLDDLHWRPGWIEAAREEERIALAEVVARPTWVVDGNYGALRAEHRGAVALFVWLDLPLAVTFPRLVRRCIVRAARRVPCCNGNRETLRRAFLDRESVLLWALQTHVRRRRQLTEELAGRPHVRLRCAAAVERWTRGAVAATRLSRVGSP
jgi:adenylate kinase family enzyme